MKMKVHVVHAKERKKKETEILALSAQTEGSVSKLPYLQIVFSVFRFKKCQEAPKYSNKMLYGLQQAKKDICVASMSYS